MWQGITIFLCSTLQGCVNACARLGWNAAMLWPLEGGGQHMPLLQIKALLQGPRTHHT